MSSDLQSVLASIQLNDYISVAIATALGYDYLLTFAQEIEYVWKRPWSWVSTLFIVVCITRTSSWIHSELSLITDSKFSRGIVLYNIGSWTFLIFLAVADLLMILRVYAMYNRSRIILFILLGIYLPTVVVLLVAVSLDENPSSSLLVTSAEVMDVRVCTVTFNGISRIATYLFIPRFILGVLLCILAITQFIRQSLEMHAVLKRWRSNQYMELLVRESILYFVANLLYNVTTLLNDFGASVDHTAQIVMSLVSYPLPVRELYSHAAGEYGDTGFGVSKNNTNTIMFASAGMIPGDVEMTGSAGAGTVEDDSGAETPEEAGGGVHT
ncbi:hypothetical protein BU15DRAFT_67125 [Melanogaster broomeanus]|nr:hypothetical protein BU15DRAFT_67125 [Melanogaster broomeanus]